MTKRRNRIIFISILAVIVISFITILCICLSKRSRFYKYNGEIYKDSYDYKDDYGYKYLKETNPTQTKLYEDLYLNMTDFYHKNLDVKEEDCYTLFYKEDKNNNTLTQDEIMQVYFFINIENPKFYWMTYNFDENDCALLGICRRYRKKSDRTSLDKKINDGLKKIDKIVENVDDEFDKLKTIYDYIVGNMKYAYDENRQPSEEPWAHNIIGFFVNNKGVCETYAKTFKFLCDRYNIGNIPLISQDHIWNLALFEDEWYIFDLTGDGHNYTYFGKTEEIYEIDPSDRESHEYSELLYPLPDNMAKTPLSFGLIDLREDGNIIATSHSMDTIFSYFNNGNYEIVLNKHEDEVMTKFYLSYIDSNYNTLTIDYNKSGPEYYGLTPVKERAIISLEKDIILTKDITIKEASFIKSEIKARKIILNDATIYLKNVFLGTNMVTIEGDSIVYLD